MVPSCACVKAVRACSALYPAQREVELLNTPLAKATSLVNVHKQEVYHADSSGILEDSRGKPNVSK